MSEDTFEITHEARIIGADRDAVCCIIDSDPQSAHTCARFLQNGYDYNLKGVILRSTDGHRLACRYMLRDDTSHLDYRIAPSHRWIAHLRRSRSIAIADTAQKIMLAGSDISVRDIDDVLQRFYTPGES